MSSPPFDHIPSGTGATSTTHDPGSENARSSGAPESVRKDRRPSPPPPVAGQKRALHAASAHMFQNGKLPKLHFFDQIVPLELNYQTVKGNVPYQSPYQSAESESAQLRYVASMPTRAPQAGSSRSEHPSDVRGWNSGTASAEQYREPTSAPQAAAYRAAARAPSYTSNAPYPNDFGLHGKSSPRSQPDGPLPPAFAEGPYQDLPFAPVPPQMQAPSHPHARAHAFPQPPAPSPSHPQMPPPSHSHPPAHAFPQPQAPAPAHLQMPPPSHFSQPHTLPQQYMFPQPPAFSHPHGFAQPQPPPAQMEGHAGAHAPYVPFHSEAGYASARYANQSVPQHGVSTQMDWEQQHPLRGQEFLHQARQERGWEHATPLYNADREASGHRQDSAKVVDADEPQQTADKGKGKATNWARATVEEDTSDSPPPQAAPSTPNIDHMTNSFGVMLLDHVQQANDQLNKKMSEFMAQQNAAQERLRHTVTHEVRAVHAKVAQLQNPMPLHAHRRTGRFGEDAGGTPPRSQQSPATQKVPTSPATPKRVRADRAKPTMEANTEAILTTLKSSVRTHLRQMLKFTTWEELVSRQPPFTEAELKAFRTGRKSIACSEDNFRIDFIQEWKRFPVNLAARDFFVQNMLKCIKGGAFDFDATVVPSITEGHVQYSLDTHMEYCRRKYRDAYNRQGWDSDDAEDVKMIAKQAEKAEKVKKRKAINSRKKTLFDARLCVVLGKGLARHSLLFNRLLPQNMSGDETDGPERKLPMAYRIIESRWQSVVFKTFMRALDALYRESWEKPVPGKRATGGNAPRTRVPRADGHVEDGHAPVGLWRNCYDRDWLRSLEPYQRRALKIVNADYDFDLTPEPAEDEEEDAAVDDAHDSGMDGEGTADAEGSDDSEVEIEVDI